jgi:hypothetical protein
MSEPAIIVHPAALLAGDAAMTEILHSGHDRLKDHPFAGLFDLLSTRELADLSENIAAHGQREPVMIHRNMILDGRNRYRACRLKGLPVRYEQFPGTNDEALDYVISKNVYRRHLSSSQRALAMASYEEYRHGASAGTWCFKMPIGILVTLRRLPCRRPAPNLPSAAMYPNVKSPGPPWSATMVDRNLTPPFAPGKSRHQPPQTSPSGR